MITNRYKVLFFLSLIANLILIAILLKPLPKEEQEMLNVLRELKANQATILPEPKSNEIKQVSNQFIIKLSQNWDVETAKPLFSKEVLEKVGEEKLTEILNMFSILGKFREKSLPESVETVPNQPNLMIYGNNVKFEAGEAYVRLILEKVENNWYINRININSEIFLKKYNK